MAQTIDDWLESAVSQYKKKPLEDMSHLYFFRDPNRAQIIDRSAFFSPCDGILIYQEEVHDPEDTVLEVKGETYSLQDIIQNKEYDKPSMVAGCFMTFYHQHVQRSPYGGFLKHRFLPPISTRNLPMLWVEKGIIDQEQFDYYGDLRYIKKNERVLCSFYSPRLRYEYFIVIIADVDVKSIMLFDPEQNQLIPQNERFCFIRWGSQVDTILPLDNRYRFRFINNVTDSVQAGLDPLIRVERRKSFARNY